MRILRSFRSGPPPPPRGSAGSTATSSAAELKYKSEADFVTQQVKSQIEAARNAAQLTEGTAREKKEQAELLRAPRTIWKGK